MAQLVRLPATPAQRALARYRDEERAFGLVLEILKRSRRDELFLKLFTVYRSRMLHLRRLFGGVRSKVEAPPADDLQRSSRERDP
jgi:hypothetical protein